MSDPAKSPLIQAYNLCQLGLLQQESGVLIIERLVLFVRKRARTDGKLLSSSLFSPFGPRKNLSTSKPHIARDLKDSYLVIKWLTVLPLPFRSMRNPGKEGGVSLKEVASCSRMVYANLKEKSGLFPKKGSKK